MVTYILIRLIRRFDKWIIEEIHLNQAMCMAISEIALFLIYIDFLLSYMDISQVTGVFVALEFAIYTNFTAYNDWYTGYVYSFFNLVVFVFLLVISYIFIGVSSEFILFFIIYTGIVILCEKMKAFCRGDTEFLIVLYWYFCGVEECDFAIAIMFVTMLVSAILFDVFRRIMGRKGEMIPYTPFIVLSEFINLFVLSCI